ncbi:MAG: hypothetical protein FWH36_09470, partial [Lentimicrobiaceae bacterium]|nr:hypothetical protein [Lentimicrobiaceae bacterium]
MKSIYRTIAASLLVLVVFAYSPVRAGNNDRANVDANKVINTPADSICPPYGGRGDGNGGEWGYRKLLAAENMPGGTIDNR